MSIRLTIPSALKLTARLLSVAREPSFDGTLNLSRPVGIVERNAAEPADALTQPWRIGGRVKATGNRP